MSDQVAACLSFVNFELILVDDGSTDNCGKICDDYLNKDSRIKVIHKKNGGISSARNAGLDCCEGEYVMFVDSDDYINSIAFEKMMNEELNTDVVIFGYEREEPNTNTIDADSDIISSEIERENYFRKFNSNSARNDFGFVWNKLYKNSIIKKSNIRFNENLYIREDLVFNLEYFKNVNKILGIDNKIYHYVQYKDGLSKKMIKKDDLDRSIKEIESNMDYDEKLINNFRDSAISSVITNYIELSILSRDTSLKNKNKEFSELKEYKRYIKEINDGGLFSKIYKFCFNHNSIRLAYYYYEISVIKRAIRRKK